MRAFAVTLLLLLAGCIGAEDAPPALEPASTPSPSAPSPTPAPSPSAPSPNAPLVTKVSWDGATSSAVCPVVTCHIVEEGSQSWAPFTTLGVAGRATRVTGTLTWEAETPATTEMRVFVFGMAAEDEPPVSGVEFRGPSPLAFDVDLSTMEGAYYAFSIHGHHEVGPVIVEKGQPFHMDAEIVSTQA